ncbi:MAG: J domain-containing protein [Chloroflexota bacterium]|nr:J domain-containing protein [Chloroflexota bacterium]
MDWVTRLTRKMMASAQKGMAQGMQEGMREVLDQMVKGTLDPAKIAAFAKAMGIDMSQLPGMVGQRPGFDAYQILGLDRSASDEEVKKRYHELLHKLHPDTAGVEGTAFLLQMVLAAYEMIKKERGWK